MASRTINFHFLINFYCILYIESPINGAWHHKLITIAPVQFNLRLFFPQFEQNITLFLTFCSKHNKYILIFRLKYQFHFDISAEMCSYKLYSILNRTLIIQPLFKLLSLDHNPVPAIQEPFRTRIFLYQTSHFLISNMEIYRSLINCHKIFFIKCNA